MVMSMGTCVFADGETTSSYTITLTNTTGSTTHTYKAYQVFAGTVSSDGKMTVTGWGSGVNSTLESESAVSIGESSYTSLITALQSVSSTYGTKFSDVTTAEGVATILNNYASDSTSESYISGLAGYFAEVVAYFLKTSDSTAYASFAATEGSDGSYTATVSAAGYYLITDSTSNGSSSTTENVTAITDADEAISDYILKVVGAETTASVTSKEEVTSLTKEIVGSDVTNTYTDDDNESVTETSTDNNTVADDEIVKYRLTATLPDLSDYSTYYLAFSDTLSGGLTLKVEESTYVVKVYVSSNNVSYDVTSQITGEAGSITATNNTTSLSVVINNVLSLYYTKSGESENTYVTSKDKIIVEYYAVFDADSNSANSGNTANTNSAYVTYSNNPNSTSYGKTTTEQTQSYTTKLTVKKVVSGTETWDSTLSGVKFKLYEVVSTQNDATGYINTSTGSYTAFDAYSTAYTLGSNESFVVYIDEKKITSADGNTFTGLEAGTYILVESDTPSGYNTIDPVTLVLTYTCSEDSFSWAKATNDSSGLELTNGVYSITIANSTGSELPGTGGIGTTIFYIVGVILVLGAAVILVTRRRMTSR